MKLRRFDLPLRQSAGSRFLPWTIGTFLYLAIVALAVAATADEALRLHSLRSKMVTVTLPSVQDASRSAQEMAATVNLLRKTRGVTSAVPVPTEEVAALVEPWLGDGKAELDLPLPRLIDVALDPHVEADLAAIEQRLRRVVEGASVGAAASAQGRAEQLTAFFRAWAGAAGILALSSMLALVGLITWVSVRMNRESIELLRCLGAPDRYLARQFERHALVSSIEGGSIGFVLAVLTAVGMFYSAYRMQLTEAIELHLPPRDWLLLACVPVAAALLITAVARLTALWGLARTP